MFWGSFHGDIKGPGLFWEKDWGTIKSRSYCERIVPLIQDYLQSQQGQNLQLMQDSAPSHASTETRAFMARRGLRPIYWPSRSPDLNPIEAIWDKMKDWIDDRLPSDDHNLTHPELRQLVQGAWDNITPEQLHREISKMPGKCREVINADEGHIKG
jgi:ketohexokinase/beta-glucosidase